MIDFWSIVMGIGGGITYALSGWVKAANETWQWPKFMTTVTIGAIAGLGVALLNLPIESLYQYILAAGIVPVIQNLYTALLNKLKKA